MQSHLLNLNSFSNSNFFGVTPLISSNTLGWTSTETIHRAHLSKIYHIRPLSFFSSGLYCIMNEQQQQKSNSISFFHFYLVTAVASYLYSCLSIAYLEDWITYLKKNIIINVWEFSVAEYKFLFWQQKKITLWIIYWIVCWHVNGI